jgi:hypothetical protein
MNPGAQTTAVAKLDVTFTIPASGTPAQVKALLSAAVRAFLGLDQTVPTRVRSCIGGKILANGATAWKWTMPGINAVPPTVGVVPVAAAADMNEPASDFLDTYVVSDGAAIPVVAVLYLGN